MHILEVLDDDLGVEFGRHHCNVSDLPSRATALAAGALCRSSKLIMIKKIVWF